MIKIYNRNTSSYDEELVAGKKYIDWVYESPVGKRLTELFVKKKLFSKVYGMYCDSKVSKSKINAFIKDFNIDMNECIESSENFKCFNDFFIRELKPEARPIDFNECSLISPGDGRLSVHSNIDVNNLVQIKNITYSFSELINDDTLASKYDKGYCLILRLAPIDYHRFHFIDSGIPSRTTKIKGFYYSVNPTALDNIPKLFCQNKREYSILESDNFGDVLIMEVGATCVGSIIQTYIPNSPVKRGDEKGYFKFGGSTVVMFFEPNKIKIDEDILTQSKLGFESKVLFGERIGSKI